MRTALLLIVLSAAIGLAAESEPPDNPSVLTANKILDRAGLPAIPEKAGELECYAWTGLGTGIYTTFVLKKPAFTSYLASFPAGLAEASPIPRNLLAPPNPAAPWFTPETIDNGSVLYRGRIANAAPEIFRVYVDVANLRVFLYYTWNNKRTYP